MSGCGGGGGGGAAPVGFGGDGWVQGNYLPESHYQAMCQNPRSGTDPLSGQPYPDTQGSTLDENFWLRSWSNDWYLWYSELQDIDPGTYADTASYFAQLKTSATDALGNPKDKFHFTVPTAQWEQLTQNGLDIGYGLTWAFIQSKTTPRKILAAYMWPAYAVDTAPVQRGYQIVSIDGVSIDATDQAGIDTLNRGLSPTADLESHQFVFLDTRTNAQVNVTLQARQVIETPVAITQVISPPGGGGPVGYILFNDLAVASSEQELIDAINMLNSHNVRELVLDLRYNGGGFVDLASELAYEIAGTGLTAGKYFERETFNSKHPSNDPNGRSITPTPFHTTTQGFSTQGMQLPSLNLSRVFVLTSSETCSASEAIMNGLIGAGVQVIQIGSTTCGKPYGFFPQDNCGTTYFSIEFQGDNSAAFGNYPDGFTPQNSSVASRLDPSAVLPGCSVADDFQHDLGDPTESRTAAALAYAAGGNASCPAPSGLAPPPIIQGLQQPGIQKAPWRTIRILRQPPPG